MAFGPPRGRCRRRWSWWRRSRSLPRRTDLLEKRESLYNNIFIFGDTDNVTMTFGQNKRYYTESSMKLSDPGALTVEYTRYMTLGIAYPPKVERIARDRPRRRSHRVLSQRVAARHRHPRGRARQGRGRSRQEILQVPGDGAAADGGVRRPGLPAQGQRKVGRHPDRRLPRAVRAVSPADQGVLHAGEVAAQRPAAWWCRTSSPRPCCSIRRRRRSTACFPRSISTTAAATWSPWATTGPSAAAGRTAGARRQGAGALQAALRPDASSPPSGVCSAGRPARS